MRLELDCPKREELQAFALGSLPTQDRVRIQQHLNQCRQCRTEFEAISPATLSGPESRPIESPDPTYAQGKQPFDGARFPFLMPPIMPEDIGRLGNYRVLRTLGQGGMGIVFLAEDIDLKRPVALKVMRPEMNGEGDGWQRFIREAQTMAAIKHEHIVTIYNAGTQGDVVYFAMELLEGELLETWMKDLPPPDVGEIVRIGREVASGLAFIHGKNLVHRDIKPANIWLEAPTRRVKILDLGLARSAKDDTSLTKSGMILGTPDFMSPEQARGDPVDARTDLFSLGCILYRLCTGRKPFPGATFSAVLMSLASDTPMAPNKFNPEILASLSELVMELLARNPKDRTASARTVVQRLDEIEFERTQPLDRTLPIKLSQKPSVVRPHAEAPPRRRSYRPVIFAAVGLSVLGGFVLLAALFGFLPGDWRPGWLANDSPLEKTYLSDMKESARQNWPFQMGPGPKEPKEGEKWKKKGPKEGKEPDRTVRFKGEISPHGIFMHPPVPPLDEEPASLSYHLGKEFRVFQSDVSLNDGQESEAPCTFWVYGDGKLLWQSRPVWNWRDAQNCRVDVRDVDDLKLAVTCSGPPRGAHAIWIEPFVAK